MSDALFKSLPTTSSVYGLTARCPPCCSCSAGTFPPRRSPARSL